MNTEDLSMATLADLRPDLVSEIRGQGFTAGLRKGLADSLCMTGEAVQKRLAELDRHGRRHTCRCVAESDPEAA